MEATTIGYIYQDLFSRANQSGSLEVQRLLAVLEATHETIAAEAVAAAASSSKSQGAKQKQSAREKQAILALGSADGSPVAYFGSFLSALERSGTSHAKELFFLLARLLPHIPSKVLQNKFIPAARVLVAGLESHVSGDEPTMRSMLSCAGEILSRGASAVEEGEEEQEDSEGSWKAGPLSLPIKLFTLLLSHATGGRPKVRRLAAAGVLSVLRVGAGEGMMGEGASVAAGMAVSGFSSCLATAVSRGDRVDVARLEYLFPLVKASLPLIPVTQLTAITPNFLRLLDPGAATPPRLAIATFDALRELFESPRARLSIKYALNLLRALASHPPSKTPDTSQAHASHQAANSSAYAYACAAGITRLASMERKKSGSPLAVPSCFKRGGGELAETGGAAVAGPAPLTLGLLPSLIPPLLSCLSTSPHSKDVQVALANSVAVILTASLDGQTLRSGVEFKGISGGASSTTSTAPPPPSAPSLLHILQALREGILENVSAAPSWPVTLPLFAVFFRLLGPALALSSEEWQGAGWGDGGEWMAKALLLPLCTLREGVAGAAAEAEIAASRARDEEEGEEEEEEEGEEGEEEGGGRTIALMMRKGEGGENNVTRDHKVRGKNGEEDFRRVQF